MKRSCLFRLASYWTALFGALTSASLVTVLVGLQLTGPALAASPDVKPEALPEFLAEKGRTLSALKATMSIQSLYEKDQSRQDVKGFFLYRRPSDFRFQGVGPGGSALFELVIKANVFELYVPQQSKIIKGDKDCFSRKFPDVAEIEGVIPLMLLQWKQVRFDRLISKNDEKIVMRMLFQGKVWGATLETRSLFLQKLVRLSPGGEVDLIAEFADFKSGDYGWLPHRFEVRSPLGKWKTLVHIEKVETNPFLVEKNFQLQPMFSTKTENCR